MFGRAGQGPRLKPGEALSIVVLGHAGAADVVVLEDEWNAVAVDGKKSVLFSQMVQVGGTPEVLLPERDSARK